MAGDEVAGLESPVAGFGSAGAIDLIWTFFCGVMVGNALIKFLLESPAHVFDGLFDLVEGGVTGGGSLSLS